MSFSSLNVKIYSPEIDESVSPRSILSGNLLWKGDEYQIIRLDEPINVFLPSDSDLKEYRVQYVRLNHSDNTVSVYMPHDESERSREMLEYLLCHTPVITRHYRPTYNYMWEIIGY